MRSNWEHGSDLIFKSISPSKLVSDSTLVIYLFFPIPTSSDWFLWFPNIVQPTKSEYWIHTYIGLKLSSATALWPWANYFAFLSPVFWPIKCKYISSMRIKWDTIHKLKKIYFSFLHLTFVFSQFYTGHLNSLGTSPPPSCPTQSLWSGSSGLGWRP